MLFLSISSSFLGLLLSSMVKTTERAMSILPLILIQQILSILYLCLAFICQSTISNLDNKCEVLFIYSIGQLERHQIYLCFMIDKVIP